MEGVQSPGQYSAATASPQIWYLFAVPVAYRIGGDDILWFLQERRCVTTTRLCMAAHCCPHVQWTVRFESVKETLLSLGLLVRSYVSANRWVWSESRCACTAISGHRNACDLSLAFRITIMHLPSYRA